MKIFMCFQNGPSKMRFTAFLSFLFIGFFVIGFQACRKESLVGQEAVSYPANTHITINSAQSWFNTQYGPSNFIAPVSHSANPTNDTTKHIDKVFFPEPILIKPLWSDAQISSYLKTQSIVIVPVEPIPYLDAKEMHYLLVFFQNSAGDLNARLQTYRPTVRYKTTHSQFSVDDFSGLFYQIGMDGLIQKVFAVENGKFSQRIYLSGDIANSNVLQGQGSSGCGCWDGGAGAGILDEIWCMMTCAVNTVANYFIMHPNDSGSSSHGGYLAFGGINSGIDNGAGSTNNPDGNPSGTTGSGVNTSGGLSGEIDNSFFSASGGVNQEAINKVSARTKYLDAGFSSDEFEKLWADQVLFGQVDAFLNNSEWDDDAKAGVKELILEPSAGPGYPLYHGVSSEIRHFNRFIYRAIYYSNNFSDIYFHDLARGVYSSNANLERDIKRKSIGAIGEGIMANKINDESSAISIVTQGSTKGGYQHDILLRVPLYTLNSTGTHDLRVHFTDEQGSHESYTLYLNSHARIGRISYEIKTFSDNTDANYIIDGFEKGVEQIQERTGVLGANAGVLVFDKKAYEVVKNHPKVITAVNKLNSFRDSNNNRRGFLRLEDGLRDETNRAYYSLIDKIKNIAP